MNRLPAAAALAAGLALTAGCSATTTAAQGPLAVTGSATPTATPTATSPAPSPSATAQPADVTLTAHDLGPARGRAHATRVDPAGDARVRTLLTWCTHTADTEDPAPTHYGSMLTIIGKRGPDTLYSYARTLGDTAADARLYAARLESCMRRIMMPVFRATLGAHIEADAVRSTVTEVPLRGLPAGVKASAAQATVVWHATASRKETDVWNLAVVFGPHTEVTVIAAGADGLTTGPRHVRADVAAIASRLTGTSG